MISKSKRILSSVLAMILLITGLLPMSVSAADVTMDLSKAEVSWDYTLTDEEGNAFAAAYGLKAEDNPFGGAISPMLRRMHDYTAKRPGLTSDKSQWVYGEDYVYCFCIEHGVPLPDSGSYSGSSDLTHGNKYEMLSENQKTLRRLRLPMDIQTVLIWKQVKTPTRATVQHSSLCGRLHSASGHQLRN